MAEFKVILSNNAEKGLRSAQPKPKERMKEALEVLKTNPVPTQLFDVTKISAKLFKLSHKNRKKQNFVRGFMAGQSNKSV
ncbi:MAG: hypothetical protein NUV67_04300 [archaeon]|nr:hypothetical protein [archaeon]